MKLALAMRASQVIDNGKLFSVFQNGLTPLHLAAQRGSTGMLRLLVRSKASVNMQTEVLCDPSF